MSIDPRDRPLPLTEQPGASCLPVTEQDIRTLVDGFYEVVKRDSLLGPIFDAHVQDWSMHLPKMYDFWSMVVLKTARYAGRPFEAHAKLPGLTVSHFDRWLKLWTREVERVIRPEAREPFILSARKMAISMASRVQ